jgi:hypothetical protein
VGLALGPDHGAVEEFVADGAYPPFGERAGLWSSGRMASRSAVGRSTTRFVGDSASIYSSRWTKDKTMLELISDLPDGVLGITAVGQVDDDDYENVLIPAIEDQLSRHDKIRLLYVLGSDFEGYEMDAMWEDAKLGLKTFTSFARICVVTDASWIRRSISAFGWLMPGDVKVFAEAELGAARDWVVA